MLVGEGPGADEDRSGRPFVGRSGQVLDRLLAAAGIARSDVFIANIVACRPPKNRNPRVGEIRAHAPWLEEQIRLVSPSLLVTLGRVPLVYFLPGSKVTRIRGVPQTVERPTGRIPLLPTFHPAVTFRRRETLPLLEQDFAAIPELLAET